MTAVSLNLGRTYRHVDRYRQILMVLIKYGFEDVVHNLQVERHLDLVLDKIARPWAHRVEKAGRAERVRLVLEELGPAFIKVGQFLSTRADLLPAEYLEELSKLQDRVPSFPSSEAKAIVEAELGRPFGRLFERFEAEPFAAASIGQAHRARTRDGEEVVVKVQRPGIRQTVSADLDIMRHLAALADRHLEGWKNRRAERVVEEWAHTLERELDYTVEASHMERFAREFARDPTVRAPRVVHAMLSPRVLTMEWLDGVKVSRLEDLEREGHDRRETARRALRHMMKAVFLHGFFHADPHPGNIVILPNMVVGYLDFGMMGRLDARSRESLADLIYGIVRRDAGAVREAVTELAVSEDAEDPARLEKELAEMIDQHAYRPLKEVRVGVLLQQLLAICSRYDLVFPSELFLLTKSLTNLESVIRRLDPEFDVISEAAPFVRRVEEKRLSPSRVAEEVLDTGLESWRAVKSLPRELRDVVRQLGRGKLKVEFEHQGLEPLLANHDQVTNRIAFSLVLSALIIGSSLIVLADVPPRWHGIPVVGLSGYILAALMGFRLLISILRHGKL